ncbi:MAG: hypothetical protein K5639_03635 [Eubacterium sp.]|nr:hypothetical protein [Eubacterium sp.]
MKLELILALWVLVCSLIGSIYGISQFFRPKKALYLQMITSGVICLMFSSLFRVIFLVTQGDLFKGFHIGLLGIVGSLMFFLSANYGQVDGLVDDKTKTFRKTRIIALLVPIAIAAMYVFMAINVNRLDYRISAGIVTFFLLFSSYYNFKHLIIYDVELGIVRSMRMYNALAVIYEFLVMIELMGTYMEITPLCIVSGVGMGIISLLIIPVVKGGAKKWTI